MKAMMPFVSGSSLHSIRVTGGTPAYSQCSFNQSGVGLWSLLNSGSGSSLSLTGTARGDLRFVRSRGRAAG